MKNLYNVFYCCFIISALALAVGSCKKETPNSPLNPSPNSSITNTSITTIPESDGGQRSTGLPDLTIDGARMASSVVVKTRMFRSSDCAILEGCVGGPGKRKLMRFDVATPNIGTADLVLGIPSQNPDMYTYSACHGHYHFNGYATYELLNSSGAVVLAGRKQAFCLMDLEIYTPGSGPAKFNCSNQGLTTGWQDVYGGYLDCQWLDITGIPRGNYQLRVSINPDGTLIESDYTNNIATVPVVVPR